MDSIGRADAMLSARRPGITASSLRSRVESSVRSAYDLGSGVLGSGVNSLKSSIPDNVKEGAQRFTLACLFIVAVEFAERFVYYSGKNMFGTYTKVNPFPSLPYRRRRFAPHWMRRPSHLRTPGPSLVAGD